MTLPNSFLRLRDLNRASPRFSRQLAKILDREEYVKCLPNLHGEDLVWLVEFLDRALADIPDPASPAFQKSLRELGRICSAQEILPESCTLSASLLGTNFQFVSGYTSEGTLDGSKVCVKHVWTYPNEDPQKAKKSFYQTAVVWKRLKHQNLVPLLGITSAPLQFILEWMPGGDLGEYITNCPRADRLRLLSDIAEGLNYLHSCNVVHGVLKGSNILLDANGCARITDFGLATIIQSLDSIRRASAERSHSTQWIAPEILDGRSTYSKEGDIFSLAMVIIEIFTCAVPFKDSPPTAAILEGRRPPQPSHPTFTDGLWRLTQRCWDQEAQLRPRVSEVLQVLRSFGTPAWKRLIDGPHTVDERISLITDIFSNRDETKEVTSLHGDDAQPFVDAIDETLDNLAPRFRRKCLSALCRICGRQSLLPRSLQIPLCYDRLDTPLCRGGYADVWKGEYQGRLVAVKALRVYSKDDFDEITSRFCKEVVPWKTLRHPNVMPLLGVTMGNQQFAMASEWMENGNINEFVKAHGDVNRFELLKGAIWGLIYMHGEGMVHGDLKGANILIDQHGHARLADFGLLTIISDHTNPTASTSSSSAGTTRWMSPELLDPERFGFEKCRRTTESDCYAFGMVILEVLSGRAPFPRHNHLTVMRKVTEGERPGRPRGAEGVWFTADLWEVLESCWSSQPKNRPNLEAVLECLKLVSPAWQPLPPRADGDVGTGADDESCLEVSAERVDTGNDLGSLADMKADDADHSSTPRAVRGVSASPPFNPAVRSADTPEHHLPSQVSCQSFPQTMPLAVPTPIDQPFDFDVRMNDNYFPIIEYGFHSPDLFDTLFSVPPAMPASPPDLFDTIPSTIPAGPFDSFDTLFSIPPASPTDSSEPFLDTFFSPHPTHPTGSSGAPPAPRSSPLRTPPPPNLRTPQIQRNASPISLSVKPTVWDLALAYPPSRGFPVPQKVYSPHSRGDPRPHGEDVELESPIMFYLQGPAECGIPLRDAIAGKYMRLVSRDNVVFIGRGPSVSIRLNWPGYGNWSRQIPTKDFRYPPCPITRSKLAKNIARAVERFIKEKSQVAMDPVEDPRWKVGPGRITADDLVLVGLQHVSSDSWQCHLRLNRPL